MPNRNDFSLSQVDGFLVGHAEDREANTGCTAILAPDGAVASFHTPGFAPGSRETELLRPESSQEAIHGVLLAGGSAFGLAAATGVVRFLREKGVGYNTSIIRVPLVPAAVIYDYPWNRSNGTLPDENMGYRAADAADRTPLRSGRFGAGLAATAGKLAGADRCSPSGLGSCGMVDGDLQLAAVAVVSSLGSVVDPETGAVLSGTLLPNGSLAGRAEILGMIKGWSERRATLKHGHTVLAAVGTNARLDKVGAFRVSRMAATGIARTIYPAHLLADGDTVFALSSNTGPEVDLNWLGALAAEAVSRAIVRSALAAAKSRDCDPS